MVATTSGGRSQIDVGGLIGCLLTLLRFVLLVIRSEKILISLPLLGLRLLRRCLFLRLLLHAFFAFNLQSSAMSVFSLRHRSFFSNTILLLCFGAEWSRPGSSPHWILHRLPWRGMSGLLLRHLLRILGFLSILSVRCRLESLRGRSG